MACSFQQFLGVFSYEKTRYVDQTLDPCGSRQHLENFQENIASHDSEPANSSIQGRRPMAHFGKPFSGVGSGRRKYSPQGQLVQRSAVLSPFEKLIFLAPPNLNTLPFALSSRMKR